MLISVPVEGIDVHCGLYIHVQCGMGPTYNVYYCFIQVWLYVYGIHAGRIKLQKLQIDGSVIYTSKKNCENFKHNPAFDMGVDTMSFVGKVSFLFLIHVIGKMLVWFCC